MAAKDGQPVVGSPKKMVLKMMKMIANTEITQANIPTKLAIAKGAAEKSIIASKEYSNSCHNDQDV